MEKQAKSLLQPEVPRSPGNRPSSLRFISPVAQSTPLALSPPGCPTPVITRNPAFACPTPSLEWDCDPATTRLGEGVKNIPEGETPGISFSSGGFLLLEQPEEEEVTLEERVGVVEGIKALERTQIPIVSTEESIEIESPEKSEKPVNMTQREMVDMEGNIVGQIGLTKGLMAINPVTSFTSVTQMDNMNARLGEEYAKLAGRLEEWRRKYRALVDNDNYEEIKGMLDDLFNRILAYGVELRTKSQEMETNAPQPQLQPQANPRHNEVDHLQRKADMLSLAELVKDEADKLEEICRWNENEDPWTDAPDGVVVRGMKEKGSWRKMLSQLKREFTKYKALVRKEAEEDLEDPTSMYTEVANSVGNVEEKVRVAIKEMDIENENRRLYSLEDRPTSLMEYPKFSGKDTQCFYTFQEKMEEALVANKVPDKSLVAKLRENISGYPLTLVPESMKELEEYSASAFLLL